jgi:hypothetical protein
LQFKLKKQERIDMRIPPSWMLNIIHTRVGQKAAFYEYQAAWQAELQKTDKLVEIENREKTEKIRKVKLDRIIL